MITTRAVAVLCAALLAVQNPYTFAQQQQPAGASQNDSQKLLTPGHLDSLVAPIALYPDPILSQVLVASTYPIEIVEAGRWLSAHSNLKGKELTEAAAKQPWDASVQALVVLPDVLKRLDQDVGWTADLGNAFLAQQQGVMEAVQRLRQKASAAGVLQSTKEQTVTTATENNQTYIEIQPASTQVVYVPQYNPEAVWGPPLEYPYPPIYYPPSTGAIVAASAISFGVGMAVGAIWRGAGGWGGYGWGCGWGRGNNVVINNNFISSNHFNRVNVGNGNNWVHNPVHRGNVPYNNRDVANRYQGGGRNAATRPSVGQTQQRLSQGNAAGRGAGAIGQRGGSGMPNQGNASRLGSGNNGRGAIAGQQPARVGPGGGGGVRNKGSASRIGQGSPAQRGGDRIGNRSIPSGGGGNRGAFGGMNQGGNRARMNSNRGAMSRGGGGRRR
jgi:hypothetical protein